MNACYRIPNTYNTRTVHVHIQYIYSKYTVHKKTVDFSLLLLFSSSKTSNKHQKIRRCGEKFFRSGGGSGSGGVNDIFQPNFKPNLEKMEEREYNENIKYTARQVTKPTTTICLYICLDNKPSHACSNPKSVGQRKKKNLLSLV